MNPRYVFGSHEASAPLTKKEKLVQHVFNVSDPVKGKKAKYEKSVNAILGNSHILNDDEYNLWKKGGY